MTYVSDQHSTASIVRVAESYTAFSLSIWTYYLLTLFVLIFECLVYYLVMSLITGGLVAYDADQQSTASLG